MDGHGMVQLDACVVDLDRRRVHRSTGTIRLTSKETALLAYLVEHAGQVVSRDDLLRDVWGYSEDVRSRAPDTSIRTLRKKIEEDPKKPAHVLSDYGVGYRFVPKTGAGESDAMVREPQAVSPPLSNLGVDIRDFLGRDSVLAEMHAHFAAGHRLVTVTGSPGIGKSAVARSFGDQAVQAGSSFSQVWMCELTSSRSGDDIAAAVSRALDLPLDPALDDDSAVDRVGHALSARPPLLLILDNFEHLVEFAVETVGTWLERAPGLVVLVTSRERLRMTCEEVIELTPLDEAAGIALFRARSALTDATTRDHTDDAILELVQILDGNPLAIELAAARARLMGPEGVVKRLAGGLEVLTTSLRDTPTRHRTLQAAIDWSWDLLSPLEQAAYSQLSVFRGGFTLTEAEEILELSPPESTPVWEVLESLVDKSIVHLSEPTEPRFDLFESLRVYGREKLAASGDDRAAIIRHARVFLKTAEPVAAKIRRQGILAAQREYDALHENLVAALERTVDLGEAELATRLAVCVVPHLRLGGASVPARLRRLESAIPLSDDVEPAHRARLLVMTGAMLHAAHRIAEGRTRLDQGIAVAAASGAREVQALGLCWLASLEEHNSNFEKAHHFIDQAIDVSISEPNLQSRIQRRAGCIAARTERYAHADTHLQNALQLARQAGDRHAVVNVLNNLSGLHFVQGRLEEGETLLDQALELARDLDDPPMVVLVQATRSFLLQAQNRLPEARAVHDEAIAVWAQAGSAGTEAYWRLERLSILIGLNDAQTAREDLAWVESLGIDSLGRDALFICSLAHHALGSLDIAISRYQQALASLSAEAPSSARIPVLAMHAAAQAQRGDLASAQALLDEASAMLGTEDSLARGFVIIGRALCSEHGIDDDLSSGDLCTMAQQALARFPFTEEAVRYRMALHILRACVGDDGT